MAAMKPRTGDGPMEVTKEGRSLIMRVPLEGGGRLVVELNAGGGRRPPARKWSWCGWPGCPPRRMPPAPPEGVLRPRQWW